MQSLVPWGRVMRSGDWRPRSETPHINIDKVYPVTAGEDEVVQHCSNFMQTGFRSELATLFREIYFRIYIMEVETCEYNLCIHSWRLSISDKCVLNRLFLRRVESPVKKK
jgi:hypothetical protein